MDIPAFTPNEINLRGQNMFRSGKYSEAAMLFQEASRAFLENGNDLMAAEAANNSSVAFLKNGDPVEALAAALGTELVFATAGDKYRQALALGNQAAAHEALGNYKEAIVGYQRSSELLKKDEHPETRAYVLQSLSALQMRMGNQVDAIVSMTAALENKPEISLKERVLKKLLRLPFRMLGSKD